MPRKKRKAYRRRAIGDELAHDKRAKNKHCPRLYINSVELKRACEKYLEGKQLDPFSKWDEFDHHDDC